MKKEKIIIAVIISILLIGTKVEAATGKGICYGKEILNSTGYCKLDTPASIILKTYQERPLMMNNGEEAIKQGFHGIVEGEDQEMFCIDPNLSQPVAPYPYARAFNLNTDYDRAIAKVYSMYVEDTVAYMNAKNVSFEAASNKYIQMAYVAMRALTVKYEYDIVGTSVYRDNIFDNVYEQFEGKNAKSPKLVEGTAEYSRAQSYYCSAILTCKTCNKAGTAKAYCSRLAGVSTAEIKEYNFKFKVDPEEIETVGNNPEKFERIVPIKITGLNLLLDRYNIFKVTNPYFYIKEISCDNDKLNCTPVENGLYDKNIVEDSPGKSYR